MPSTARPFLERVNSGTGYRHRHFDTRIGTLDVAISDAAPRVLRSRLAPGRPLPRGERADERRGDLLAGPSGLSGSCLSDVCSVVVVIWGFSACRWCFCSEIMYDLMYG